MQPNFHHGWARNPGESLFPMLWDRLELYFAPFLGAQGLGTVTMDMSKNRHSIVFNGSKTGGDWIGSAKGVSLIMDGNNDYLTITAGTINGLTTTMTKMGWFLFDDVTNNRYIFDIGTNSNYARVFDAKIGAGILGGDIEIDTASFTALTTNTWYHIAVRSLVTVRSVEIFINGQLAGSGTAGTSDSTPSTVNIGRYGGLTSGYNFDGLIGEASIYSRRLSQEEIYMAYLGAKPLHRKSHNTIFTQAPWKAYTSIISQAIKRGSYY